MRLFSYLELRFPGKKFFPCYNLSFNYREQSRFYLICDHDIYEKIVATFLQYARFNFSRHFCSFGEPIVHQIKKVPALKGRIDSTVLLIAFNLDKMATSQIDESFREYTKRHVDLMPWSLDSLYFTGSEFERVAIVASEDTNWESRETISVLKSIRSLLSLSPVDLIFNKLRSSDKLRRNLCFKLENQNDILEAFKFIIVSKNVSQFNASMH